jgi:AraC-like DNA-binding protein
MNHEQALCKTNLVGIYRFTHSCEEPHRDPKEEFCDSYSINFTEQDQFGLRVGPDEWLMTDKQVFFTQPGMVFRCRHFAEIPRDVCVSVNFDDGFVEEIRRAADLSLTNYRPALKLNNRLAFLHWRLAQSVLRQETSLAIETLAGELFVTAAEPKEPRKLCGDKLKRRYFERVEAAGNLLKTSYAENHSLGSLSRRMGMSSFHFARVFRELSGVAPHQYLLRVRLEKAVELLLENLSVTETCYAVGFTNLSHFIRTFTRRFGVSPAKFSLSKKLCLVREQQKGIS